MKLISDELAFNSCLSEATNMESKRISMKIKQTIIRHERQVKWNSFFGEVKPLYNINRNQEYTRDGMHIIVKIHNQEMPS